MKFFQRLGRSIMLPVAVLPVAAILMGISYWLQSTIGDNLVGSFLNAAGGALLGNMALLFAIGIAIGMANKSDGTSALAGLVSWLVVTAILSPETVRLLTGAADVADVNPAFGKIQNVFVGIACGLIGAWCYNKFKDTKLPNALAFFSGKRSVALAAAGISLVFAVFLLFVWPVVYSGLVTFGEWVVTLGPIGTGIYGMLNRLLIPLGLHHALNSVFWFDVAGINDLNNFLAGTGTYGVTGQYMTGFFPIMMFGLPGAALAMYLTAKTTRKKVTYGLMLSGSIASFLVGVTEPLEFAFLFVAPLLYVVHAVFTGISMIIATLLPVRMGFGFSAGFIDLTLGWVNPMAENPWIIIPLGVFWFLVYFATFYFIIRKFNLKTPGREDDDVIEETSAGGGSGYHATAAAFIAALGGAQNISELDNCATRLRMEIVDVSKVDEAALKTAGAAGTMKAGRHSVQVVYGLNVQFVKDAMEDVLAGRVHTVADPPPAAATTTVTRAATVVLRQPVAGRVIPLAEVPDPMFAMGTMGPGLAIDPTGDTVIAPADAIVGSVFATGHAIGLVLADGTELLVHVGIDTVSMEGEGFEPMVTAGDEVAMGAPLLRFDLEAIRAAGLSPVTPVVVLNNESAVVEFRG
ncbi:MAG: N-acetylglucosamine-specific PTS transporter subunit IIBC [Microbacterium sp.]